MKKGDLTLQKILDEIHKNFLGKGSIRIGIFPLNKEVAVHFNIGNTSYTTSDVDPNRAVSDLVIKLSSVNGYDVEFDPCALFLKWYKFEICDPYIAILTLDRIYKERAFRNASTQG